jgi:hypothetical protein
MHLELLVEDRSTEAALSALVPEIVPDATFRIHPHGGKRELLGRLPGRLRGYARSRTPEMRIVIVIDEDREDCLRLKRRIATEARRAGIHAITLVRIAVEELEAWFLGDEGAVVACFPRVTPFAGRRGFRDPDAVAGGTWEALERLLQQAGEYPAGLLKIDAATRIAALMNVDANRLRSFCAFRDGLRRLAEAS